ncbi:MAG: hypothetical protein GXW99_07020 [Clostridiales bacterium]|nr:hypothetical protein [Clostridiales bacterium]
MALYMTTNRCAVCGSKNLDVVCNSCKTPVYHCRACGADMSQAMEASMQSRIDLAQFTGAYSAEDARSWKRQYQNLDMQDRHFISGAMNL